MIPIGNYMARVGSFQWGKTATDKPYVRLLMVVEGGEHEGSEITSDVFVLRKNGEPNEIAREKLMACGWDGKDIAALDGVTEKAVNISVMPDSYTDKSGNVKTVHRAEINFGGGRRVKHEVDKADLANLALKFKAAAAASGQVVGNTHPDDDDFPV